MMTYMPSKTERIAQLERDLAEAQKALTEVVVILKNIHSENDNVFFEIGRAQGTAALGLTMSGAR